MNNWEIHAQRFIAFFDILGFKDMVLRRKPSEIYKQMLFMRDIVKFINKKYQDISSSGSAVRAVSFSDSLFICTLDVSANSTHDIINLSGNLMAHCIREGIGIKGAIAQGHLTFDSEKSIYFGQPLIDAFLLQEELKMYAVIFHHTCDSLIESQCGTNPFETRIGSLLNYKTPLKSGKIMHTHVDWIDSARINNFFQHDEESTVKTWVNRFYLSASGPPRIYTDNTVEFVDSYYVKKE